MKTISFILVALFFSIHCIGQSKLVFIDAKKNFGFVKQGKVIEMKYEFVNEGNQPLILSESKVECSCTEVVLPKDPIMPKQKAFVLVKFNTLTVFDRQDRTVEIQSNAINNPQKIRFKGVVLKK